MNSSLHMMKCWFVELLPADFEVLVCWTASHRFWSVVFWAVTNVFRIIYLLIYYGFLSVLLNCYSQILKRALLNSFLQILKSCFVVLLPTCL